MSDFIPHIRKLAIIEDASPDNVVILTNINEGVDGASDFGYEKEEDTLQIEDRQTAMDALNHTLDIRTLTGSSSEESQLDTWTSNNTQIYISALTLNGGFLWGDKQTTSETVRFYKDNQFDTRKAHKIFATKKTTPGFDQSTGIYQSGIWAGLNLLGMYEWGDKDSDNVADGWDATGFTSTSFGSGQQTLEADTTTRTFAREVWFPFEDEQITFSIDIDSRSGSYSTEQIKIEFYDSSSSLVSSATTTFSSTGRKSVTSTIPTNAVYVKSLLQLQASSGTVTSIISDPALRLGTNSTYTKY